jgi:phage-related protein
METIQAQITLDNAKAVQELQRLNQTIISVFENLSNVLSDSLGKTDGKTPGKKVGNELATSIKNSIDGLKIDKINGVAIDPNNLKKIKDDINNALSGGKITSSQAAAMLSSLNNIGKETGKKIANDISSEGKKAGVSFGDLFKSSLLASLASSGIQAAIGGIFSSIQGGFKLGADFEQQLSGIKALTGATAEEMKKIEGVALKAGKETAFSALEAAKGLEELLKAGLNASQAQEGLKGALDLAAAGGIGVADAAEIASTALNAFKNDNLSVAQASDILAGAANASATSVGELKFGLSAASAVTSAVGMSFKDTNTALALFAQNGLKGSDAGTSLKTMFLNLQPSTKAQVNLFKELGLESLNVEKGWQFLKEKGIDVAKSADSIGSAFVQMAQKQLGAKKVNQDVLDLARKMEVQSGFSRSAFFNEAGQVKKLSEISGELRKALSGMNDAQRLSALETLFGSDAIRAANILYKEGADGVNKMTDAMGKFTAADVAKEKLNNFAGTLENLKGTIETALIQTFASIIPKITPLLDQLNVAVNKINFEQLGQTIGTVLVGAVNLLSGTISFVSNNFTLLSSVLTGLVAGGVALGVVSAFTAISAAITAFGVAAAAAGGITSMAFFPITAAVVAIGLVVAGLALAWQTNFGNIQGITQTVLSTISSVWSSTWSAISSFFTATWATISGAFNSTVSTISSLWTSFTNTLSTVWNAIWETIKSFVSAVFLTIVALFTGNTDQIGGIWNSFGKKLKSIWNGIWEVVKTALSNTWTWITEQFNNLVNIGTTKTNEAGEAIKNGINSAWDFVRNINVLEIANNMLNGFVNGIKNGAGRVFDAVKNLANGMINSANTTLDSHSPSREMIKVATNATDGMEVGIDDGASGVIDSMAKLAGGVITTAKEKLQNLNLGQLGSANFGFSQLGIINDGTVPTPTTPTTPINQTPQNPNIQNENPNQLQTPTEPPADPAALTKPIDDAAQKTTEGIDTLIEKIKTGIGTAISEGSKNIIENITKMDEECVKIFNLVNEGWITIAQAIGQNVINGIILGLQKGERLIYSAIASLETNALKAVNIEVRSREEFGEEGRGAANGISSVMNPNVELQRGFKPYSASQTNNNQTQNNQKIINNNGNNNFYNNQDFEVVKGQMNAFFAG